MGALRLFAGLLLALIVAIASVVLAVARGKPRMVDWVEICGGDGTEVSVDAQGQPVGIIHLCPDCIAPFSFATLAPVFYTHLDVYKRQGPRWQPAACGCLVTAKTPKAPCGSRTGPCSGLGKGSGRGGLRLGDVLLDLQSVRRQLIILGLGKEGVQPATVIDGAQRSRRNPQLERLAQDIRDQGYVVQVRQETPTGLVAVSYTHLDVYKRQELTAITTSSVGLM